jgi:asparagine synthase (glutamine-hydrolysing)
LRKDVSLVGCRKSEMTIASNIRFHHHFEWMSQNSTYSRGSAFKDDSILSSQDLCSEFERIEGKEKKFLEVLKSLNGFFSVVHIYKNKLFAAVDLVRSLPLFYGVNEEMFYLSDDARWVKSAVGDNEREFNAEREFQFVGYVTGENTLYPNVKQLRPGQMLAVSFENNKLELKTKYHFRHKHHDYLKEEKNLLISCLDEAMISCFRNLIKLSNGRQIVVPLSGGYDSRLITLMLKKLGYSNILAFSYGKLNNAESLISKRIADALEIPWYFVQYDNEKWKKWYCSKERKEYYLMADGLCSLPVMQDFPAIGELKSLGVLHKDCIIVPGYAADLPAGSFSSAYPHLYKTKDTTEQSVFIDLTKSLFNLWPLSKMDYFWAEERVKRIPPEKVGYLDGADMFEECFTLEKVSKFVVNAVRVYEYYGYRWWLPYFDKNFINFWMQVPLTFRYRQKLYGQYIKKLSLSTMNFHLVSAKTNFINSYKGLLKNSLEKTAVWTAYMKVKEVTSKKNLRNIYYNHPLAFFGMLPLELFFSHYLRSQNINSFLSMLYLNEEKILGEQ